uniref:Uncharacterized protein n=1 Tax=Culex tarsalis TaxID=7177 RepID=A0A1Q3FLX9_CULTA
MGVSFEEDRSQNNATTSAGWSHRVPRSPPRSQVVPVAFSTRILRWLLLQLDLPERGHAGVAAQGETTRNRTPAIAP